MTGKKNHLEWNYISPVTLVRTIASGTVETADAVVQTIDIRNSVRGNTNIIYVMACVDAALDAATVIDTLEVELWGRYTVIDDPTEYWVRVAEDLNNNIVHGKLIRFEALPPGIYKVVVRDFTSAGNDLNILTSHTE